MSWDHAGWPAHFDYEDPDGPVDDSVIVVCEDCDETWNPEVFFEYQGVTPHGGMVSFYTDDAFECGSCGKDCEDV